MTFFLGNYHMKSLIQNLKILILMKMAILLGKNMLVMIMIQKIILKTM